MDKQIEALIAKWKARRAELKESEGQFPSAQSNYCVLYSGMKLEDCIKELEQAMAEVEEAK